MADLLLTGGVHVTVDYTETDAPNNLIDVYFDIIQDHSITIQNQITDNFLENNTAIQDHIAHMPLTISLHGLSAEVIYKPPEKTIDNIYSSINKFIGKHYIHNIPQQGLYSDKLIALSALYPPVDNVTQLAKNAVQYAEASINRYTRLIDNIRGISRLKRLQKIYSDLIKLRNTNTALLVETPYAAYENMYIQSVSLKQGNQEFITDIELTLKQVNFAYIKTTKADPNILSKYTQFAKASIENHGNIQGKTVDNTTLLKGWTNKAGLTEQGSGIRK